MSEDTTPTASAFADVLALLNLIADPRASQRRLDQHIAAAAREKEEKTAADRSKAALAQAKAEHEAASAERTAALDAREAELAVVEARWRERLAAVEAREEAVSKEGQVAEIRKIRDEVNRHENYLRATLMNIAGLNPHYNSLLNDMPGFSGVVEEILSDHGLSPDGAPMDASVARPEEAVFQSPLPMLTYRADSASGASRGKPQRHGAPPRV